MSTTAEETGPSTERGEETRRHILEVAARLFAESGYIGASFSRLVEASGLTKGAFYFHFPSKEALALAVFADQQARWADAVREAADPTAPAVDQLVAMLEGAVAYHDAVPSARAVARLCVDLAEDPSLRPELTPFLASWEELVTAAIRKGQEEGDLRRDIDAAAAARVSVAAFIGLQDVAHVVSGGSDLRRRAEEFLTFFMTGLRQADRRDPARPGGRGRGSS